MSHTLGSKSWISAGSCSISGALGAGVCLHGRPDSLAQKELKAKRVKPGAWSEGQQEDAVVHTLFVNFLLCWTSHRCAYGAIQES